MAPYPNDVEARITLDDSRQVRFRALRTCEDGPVRALHGRLSSRSRYQRFLSPMPSLPDTLAREMSCVDYQSSVAIVAEDTAAARPDVIALASFSAVGDGAVELAVAVRDDWQGHGVGTALVERLLDAAERRGFRRFTASMTIDNIPMAKVLERIGDVVASRISLGVREVSFVRRRRQDPTRPSTDRA